MYNILIVEDEKIIREGIEDILKNCKGLNVFAAQNGEIALEIIMSNRIHGMILDIRMPKMDGLELLQELESKGINNIVTIILSGYNEFDSAKQAMKYGVVDYVLKPITPDDVLKIAGELIKRLENEENRQNEIEKLKKQVEDSKPLIRERFFNSLLNKKVNEALYKQKQKFIDLDFKGDYFQVVLIELDEEQNYLHTGDEEYYEILIMSISNIIERIIEKEDSCEFFHLNTDLFVLLFNYNTDYCEEIRYPILEQITSSSEDELKVSLSVGVGGVTKGVEKIKESYNQALHALSYKILLGNGNIISISDLENRDNLLTYSFNEEEFTRKIKLNQNDEAINDLNEIFLSIRQSNEKVNLYSLNLLCIRIITACLIALEQSNGIIEDIYQCKGMSPFMEFFKLKSLDEIFHWVVNFVTYVTDYINGCRSNNSKGIIEQAKEMINKNYSSDLTLKNIADRFHLSKNYFGQLFKNETDMTVNEYINMVRIKKAMELLTRSNLKVYEIAYQIGFNDQHYFSLVFKKIVGVAPTEYREFL